VPLPWSCLWLWGDLDTENLLIEAVDAIIASWWRWNFD
jgi:hypothetical protein